ncbi:MAG: hypothetical protein KDB98_00285 [Flavobacteriales bacterium]|nr:hypothetical protein [Flavobacteriales bacterium]
MDSKLFTEKYLLNEVKLIEAANVRLHLLSAIVHGIETAGALLDPLPFKAKGQGRKRFDLALNKVFPKAYSTANSELDLYNLLRSHMAHCMLPAKQIVVTLSAEHHLQLINGQLEIDLKTFYKHYIQAMDKLIQLIETNQVKNKKIVFDNLNFGQ